ncbi:MAG: hypothetical protein IKQ14_04930 [Candidatus Methanomethylophilaceae archaeon]|nr:hypothetical protein [Candidatus Methanomethylophilaceae archaeon]
MDSKQEIIDAMNGENEGQAPPALFSQTGTVELMKSCGACWPDANFSEESMIKLALQPSKLFGFATARIPFDLTSEAERLGCYVSQGDGGRQPAVTGSPWWNETIQEPPEFMPPEEFLSEGRCSMHVHVAERISREHPELFLTSSLIGPIELTGHMVGFENFIMGTIMDPDMTFKWIEKMVPYQSEYARALSEASDNVFVITEGAEDVMDPETFSIFAPYEKTVFDSIRDSFSVAHVCGTTDTVVDYLPDLGPTAVSVESHGNPQSVFDRVGDRTILVGGISPIDTMMQGTPEEVRKAALEADDAGYSVIMCECGVPPQTPNENLEALARYRG